MATAQDFLQICIAFATLKTGKGFVVHFDLDYIISRGIVADEATINKMAKEAIDARLAKAEQTLGKLNASLREAGILFKDPQRGNGIRTNIPFSEEQNKLFEQLVEEMQSVDTFVRV